MQGRLRKAQLSSIVKLSSSVGCTFSPCGCACRGEYCTVSSDGTIRGWDIASHAQLFELAAPGEVIQCCAYHPDRHELACGFDQGRVRVFDIAETALLQEHKQHRQAVLQVVYLPSGKLLFSLGKLPSYRVIKYQVACFSVLACCELE